MNFDFRKPEISFKRVIAMLLAVVMCAGQVNIDVLAKAVIRDGSVVEDGKFQDGDVSGDASGNAWYDVYTGEAIGFCLDDALDCTQLEKYDNGEWVWQRVYNNEDLKAELYRDEILLETLTMSNKDYDYDPITEEDFNSSFSYKVFYKNHEIGTVTCTIEKGLSWNAYAKDGEDFYLLPDESVDLEVVVEARNANEEIDISKFAYQWQKWGDEETYEDIPNANSSKYHVGYDACGKYRCKVSNGGETRDIDFWVSQDSGLKVSAVNGSARYVKEGEGTTLQVNAYSTLSGVTIQSYQWYKDEESISGATSDTLIVDKVMGDSWYYCVVTDSNGSTASCYFDVYLQKPFEKPCSIQATELKLNQSVDVNTKKDTYLLYPFQPKTSGWYTFYSEGTGDSQAYVLDASKNILAYNDDDASADGLNFKMNVELTGGQTYYLAVAGYDYSVISVKVIAACADHTKTVIKNDKAATCDSAGYTGDSYCANCGELVSSGSAIPAKGHSYGAWTTTKAATVLAKGEETRTCSVCGAKETREIAKKTATISVNYKTIPLAVKQSTTAVKVSYTKGDGIASWKSSNKKVATVTSKGKITGKKKGTATITVTLKSGKQAKITVKVQKKAVATTKVAVNSKSVKLKKGKKFQLKTTVTPVTSKQKVTYKTSNKKIATVTSKGKITAKKKGKATITVKSGKKSVKVKVTVK